MFFFHDNHDYIGNCPLTKNLDMYDDIYKEYMDDDIYKKKK